MKQTHPLDSLVFISLPEHIKLSNKDFTIDPAIPLPVQRDSSGTLNLENISVEMILSGILAVLAHNRENQYADYYRKILLRARPEIKRELSESAILKAHNEDFELAEEIFAALRGLDPADTAAVLNTALMFDTRADSCRRAGLHHDADSYDEDALSYYRQAMDAEPAIPDAFFNAGFFYLKKNTFDRVKDCFETYLAFVAGMSDEELGENGCYKRERVIEVINDIDARNLSDAQFKKAHTLISSGREEEGIEKIRNFLQENPDVWNAWFLLGWGLRQLERWSDAKTAFLQSIECGGRNADTLNELAICYMELGEYVESERCLLDALNIDSENTKIMSNMGTLALKQGKNAEARTWFLTVLEFAPSDTLAQRLLDEC